MAELIFSHIPSFGSVVLCAGNPKWEIAGYDDVEVVCTGIQQELAERKSSFFAADGFNISNESKGKDSAYDT